MSPGGAGSRLDAGVAAVCGLSRRRVRALSSAGAIWLNGRPARILSHALVTGDVVDVIAEGERLVSPPPPLQLPVLLDDGWLVAVDKPAGIASQARATRREGELTVPELATIQLSFAAGHRRDLLQLHRLDRITSGVMVFALQHEAASRLAHCWETGEVRKRYLAVVRGDPGEQPLTVTAPIARDPLVPSRFRVAPSGRASRSEVKRLANFKELSLVEVRPLSGRTHQIRIHLAHAGFPVAGDTLYGGGSAVPRAFLHAWRLELPHPRDKRPLRLEAPLPSDLRDLLAAAGVPLREVLPKS